MKMLFVTSGTVHSNFTYRALTLARELRARGHDVALIAPKADKYNNFKPEKIRQIDGVRILQPFQFATKRLELNLLPYLFAAARLVARERPDVVYIYKPTPISIVGLLAKLLRPRTQVVLDMDDLGSEVMKIEGHPAHQRFLVEWCERLAAKRANRIVVASTYLRDKYRAEFPQKPLHLMSNGVEPDWFAVPPAPSKHTQNIVFMGSLNRRNILEPLFDVLPDITRKYPRVRLEIIGDGKHLTYFKRKAKKLGIAKQVRFTGWLRLQDAREQLRAGDIGYNYMPDTPTVRAASNMKVPQYMARGVVPLVSNVGDLPDMVDAGRAGYIAAADNPSALRDTLDTALSDTKWQAKAAAAREYARTHVSWDVLAAGFDEWLQDKPGAVAPGVKRKVFVVTAEVPGDFGGAPIRNYQLIRQLAADAANSVEVFCLSDGALARDAARLEKTLAVRAHVLPLKKSSVGLTLRALLIDRMQPFMTQFRASGLGRAVRAACEQDLPDVIQISQTNAYFCLQPHIAWLRSRGVKIVLDAHNIELDAFKGAIRTFSPPKRLVGRWLLPAFAGLEYDAVLRSDAILACSQTDADYFASLRTGAARALGMPAAQEQEVFVIPNGVDCTQFKPARKTNASTLLFVGGVKYPANGDALAFYLREVHPLVRQAVPKAHLLAIGATADWLETNSLDPEAVEPLGFVDEVTPYLEKAVIGICPIREGSGTRLKVLTYMAAGLPVVATTKGAEGIAYTEGQEVIVADDAHAFAHAIISLLQDAASRRQMGKNGRKLATGVYDWDIIGRQLRTVYARMLL